MTAIRVTVLVWSVVGVWPAIAGGVSARQSPTPSSEVVLHVNQSVPRASDDNAGTEAAPFRTIQAASQRALQLRASGGAVRVAIHGGVYRETVTLSRATLEAAAAPLIIEGVDPDVVVAGSNVLALIGGDEDTSIQTSPWPRRFGLAPIPDGWGQVAADLRANPVVLRSEMVFVGGRLLRQAMSSTELRAGAARFFVEEGLSGAVPGTLSWRAPEGPRAADVTVVEAAVRPALFSAERVRAIVIRGITFRHAATPLQDAAVRISGCADVLLEDVRIEWNNWNGVSVRESRNVTLRRVSANHNGAGGISVWRVSQLTVEDVEASYNNWRGAWGGFTGWATGQKFLYLHGARFTRYRAVGNQATGLWLDTDIADVTIEDSHVCNNLTRGVFIEAAQGPVTLRGSVVCDNGEVGVFATAAAGVTLTRNAIYGNGEHQVFLPWQADHHVLIVERNYETGAQMQIRSQGWTLRDNTIAGEGSSLLFSAGNWPEFLGTFTSDRNRWIHRVRRDAFGLYRGLHAPATRYDLDGWRGMTRQDRSSSFETGIIGDPQQAGRIAASYPYRTSSRGTVACGSNWWIPLRCRRMPATYSGLSTR